MAHTKKESGTTKPLVQLFIDGRVHLDLVGQVIDWSNHLENFDVRVIDVLQHSELADAFKCIGTPTMQLLTGKESKLCTDTNPQSLRSFLSEHLPHIVLPSDELQAKREEHEAQSCSDRLEA